MSAVTPKYTPLTELRAIAPSLHRVVAKCRIEGLFVDRYELGWAANGHILAIIEAVVANSRKALWSVDQHRCRDSLPDKAL